MKHSILCVDDESDNVEALERLLRKKYRVLKALGGAEALDILKSEKVSVIISDQRMPKMSGVQFLERSMKLQPEAVRMLLTGYTDVESIIDAVNSGQIFRYLTKPWDPVDLANTVDKAVERFELVAELKEKNIQLQQALDELKVLDEAKNQFMILINHELKTPLTVISSYLQLLADTTLSDEQKKCVMRIDGATHRLQELIEDVLDLVMAETKLLKVQARKVSVHELVNDLKEQFKPALAQKELAIDAKVDSAHVKADEKILRSVLERLLDNAIKFGAEGSKIRIRSEEKEDRLEISMVNQGKSLTQEMIKKILKPFTLDENIMHHSKGTGLGLSICRAQLRAHDSELHIECPKGEFRASFELPLS